MARQLDPTKRKLTDIQCKSAKPLRDENGSTKPIKLSDGYGLNLEVRSDGKFWFYAFRLNGKQLKLNLGGYPTVRLSDAREMHQTAWTIVQDGEDPRQATITSTQKKRAQTEQRELEKKQLAEEAKKSRYTFKSVANEWMNNKEPSITKDTYRRRSLLLQNHVFPVIGKRQISELRVSNVLRVLKPISERGSTYQAKRCREILQQIFNYARALELCETNPAEAIRHVPAMRIHQSEHYRALEFTQMGELLKRLRDPESNRFSFARPALELLILTAVRPGNVCTARWDHFQLESDQPTWVIPAKLMKKRRDHIVPLSSQTVQLLQTIRDYNWSQVWLFPGSKDKGLSDGTLKRQLALLGYGHDQVHPHGFRSTFSTYANESGKWSRDAIEWVLAHVETNEVRGAYNRAQYLDERRRLLQWWANELDQVEQGVQGTMLNTIEA